MTIGFTVNGRQVSVAAQGDAPLLDVLRNHLDLKGTRYGCGLEQCGSCMVLLDGEPVYACTRQVGTVAGRAVTTVEGLGSAGALHPLQQAFLKHQAGQCGYCLSGILIAAAGLLGRQPDPSRFEILQALEPNLCRCGAHNRIVRAVQRAAAAMRSMPSSTNLPHAELSGEAGPRSTQDGGASFEAPLRAAPQDTEVGDTSAGMVASGERAGP